MSFVFKSIEPSHITSTPFYANKLWVINTASISNLLDPTATTVDTEVSMSVYYGCYLTGTFYSQSEYRTTNGEYIRTVWDSVYHMYYRDFQNDPWTYKQGELGVETRNITSGVTIFSIPTNRIGKGIKRGSFELVSGSLYLTDDSHGNIIGGRTDTFTGSEALKNFYYCSFKYPEGYKYSNDYSSDAISRVSFGITSFGNLKSKVHYNYNSSKGINAPVHSPNNVTGTVNKAVVNRYGPDSPFFLDFNVVNDPTGSAYIRIPHKEELNFGVNDPFSIAMWVYPITTPNAGAAVPKLGAATGAQLLLAKNGRKKVHTSATAIGFSSTVSQLNLPHLGFGGDVIEDRISNGAYPYQIELIEPNGYVGAGKIRFSRSDGVKTDIVTSSAALTENVWNLVICRYSASIFDVFQYDSSGYPAGNHSQVVANCLSTTKNECDIFAGVRGEFLTTGNIPMSASLPADGTSQFSGKLGSIHIFDKFLSLTDINGLFQGWAVATADLGPDWGAYDNHYGNIIYNQGLIILTNGRGESLSKPSVPHTFGNPNPYVYGTPTCTFDYMKFRSTKLITTNEVICISGQAEHNMPTNPTILATVDGDCNAGIGASETGIYTNDGMCYSFVTGSDFSPYITTVGLYNDAGELLVVGKLSAPLKKPTNCDTIFIVRWDS